MPLPQGVTGESWKDKRRFVDISIVVAVDLLLFLGCPASQWLGHIAVGVLATNHEANLVRWVGWDCGVSVLNRWEDFFAVLLQLGNERKMKPLILSCLS
jgi:hypothetical protein